MAEENYFKSVLILSVGTLFSQLLTILASPIYTRIFDPVSFGIFAVYMSFVLTFIPLMSGKYDLAAILQKSHAKSLLLFQIAQITTVIFSIVIAIIVFVAYIYGFDFVQRNLIAFSALPAGLLIGGISSINFNRLTRLGNFKELSKQKILMETLILVMTLSMGFAGVNHGMVYGAVIGGAIYLSVISYKLGARYLLKMAQVTDRKKNIAQKYIGYLKYNATTSVLDGLSVAMPTFFISQMYGAKEAGFFFLANKLINAPVSFLSASIAQVNLKKFTDFCKKRENILPFFVAQSIGLSAFGLLIIISWHVIGKEFVNVVFGEEWVTLDELIKIMILVMPIKFLASTLSTLLGATGSNKVAALWRVSVFVSMCIFLLTSIEVQFNSFIFNLAIFECTAYGFYYVLIVYSALLAGKEDN